MKIDNALFQDLESFEKERFFRRGFLEWKSFGFLCGKILKYPEMDIT